MRDFEATIDPLEFDPETSRGNASIVSGALERETSERLKALENEGCTRGIIRLLLDFIPVISQGQKFLQARQEYNVYPPNDMSPQALQLREVALERLMVAALEAGMDTLIFGSLQVDEVLGTWINRLKLAINTQKKGEKLPVIGKVVATVDILGRIARALLKIPEIRNIFAKLLQSNTR